MAKKTEGWDGLTNRVEDDLNSWPGYALDVLAFPGAGQALHSVHGRLADAFGFGGDEDPSAKQITQSAIRKLSDEDLLSAYSTSLYSPTGEGGQSLYGWRSNLLKQAGEKRGLDVAGVEAPENWFDAFGGLKQLAQGTAGNFGNMMKTLQSYEAAAAAYQRQEQQQAFIGKLQGDIEAWKNDPRMDSLRGVLDAMKQNPGFSEPFLDDIRGQITTQVRVSEAERLQRTNRILGMRGKRGQGSGAAAHLAHQAAAEADKMLLGEFSKIRIAAEQEKNRRQGELFSQEMKLTGFDVHQANTMNQMLYQAQQGQDVDPAAALGGLSEYLASMENAAIAESMQREASRNSLIGAGIGAVAEIGGAYMSGGMSLGATQGKPTMNFINMLRGEGGEAAPSAAYGPGEGPGAGVYWPGMN